MYRLESHVEIRRFLADESGATAIEYGLICAMIAVVLLGALASTGGAVSLLYQRLTAIGTALMGSGGS